MEKILVTGANGYIGSKLIQTLSKNYFIYAVDLFLWKNVIPHHDNIKVIKQDIRTMFNFPDVDYVIDLGAISNDPAGELNLDFTLSVNFLGRARLASYYKNKVKKYIIASSSSVYGYNDNCTEKTKTNPITMYAKSICWLENHIVTEKIPNVICLRLGTVFGDSPRTRLDTVINIWLNNIIHNQPINISGNASRAFLYIDNLINFIKNTLQSNVPFDILNVVDENFKIKDLWKSITTILNVDENQAINDDNSIDLRSYHVVPNKHYTPLYSFSTAIKRTFKKFKNIDTSMGITIKYYE